MTWQEALEIEVARTGHERFRWLCSEANSNEEQREKYRAQIVDRASGQIDGEEMIRLAAAYRAAGTAPAGAGCCH